MKAPFEAIALEYGQLKTPRVVAKGQAELARRIIEELAAEKKAAIETKHKEREAAMKVIRDNQEEKKRLQ